VCCFLKFSIPAELNKYLRNKTPDRAMQAEKQPEIVQKALPRREEYYLLEFYGAECVSCAAMEPIVKRLEQELFVKFKKIEVWHSHANAHLMMYYAKGECKAVPFFYNKKSGKGLCGPQTYETLKEWALGAEQRDPAYA